MITANNRKFIINSYLDGRLSVDDVLEFVDNPAPWSQTLDERINFYISQPRKVQQLAVLYNFMPQEQQMLPTTEDLNAL